MNKRILATLLVVFLFSVLSQSNAQHFIGGYIRPDRLETGQIGSDIVKKHTDLMVLGFHPKSNGHLQVTNHQGTLGNGATYLGDFQGRTGVMSFNGQAGGTMNGQADLLVNNKTLTFSTWLYINNQASYLPGKFIFKKQEGNKEISLRVGANYGQIIFRVMEGGVSYQATGSAPETGIVGNQWNHVAITFNGSAGLGNQVKLYVNAVAKQMTTSSQFPMSLPVMNSDFILGDNLSGYLDETLVNDLTLNPGDINQFYLGNYPFNSFNLTKTVAFWNYNDANNPGKDLRSYEGIFSRLKTMTVGTSIKLHLTISGGDWQNAISTVAGRTNFANDINAILIDQQLDGVDVDLEWPEANTDAAFANYSAFVLKLREVIGSSKKLSLSLHPAYYKVSTNAINASDYVAIQMYGPRPTWWSYDRYVESAQAALAHGIPKEKLIMGLPFFATTGVAGEQVGYRDIINVHPNIDFDLDEVTYNNKSYTFNGVTTITKKAAYVCQEKLGGIMAWDIPLDMLDYNSSHSLLRAAIAGLNSCDSSEITSLSASYEDSFLTVNWDVNKLSNINHFLVEFSTDNNTFSTIDTIYVDSAVDGSLSQLSFSSKKNLIIFYDSVKNSSVSIFVVLVLFGISFRWFKARKAILLLPMVTILILAFGCEKDVKKDAEPIKEPQYIRVVLVDDNGQKQYSDTVEVL